MSFDFYYAADTVLNVATWPTSDHRKGTWHIVIFFFHPSYQI